MTGGGDAGVDLRLMVAGTTTEVDAVAVARLRVGPIAETIPLACAAPTNAQLGSARTEMERVG